MWRVRGGVYGIPVAGPAPLRDGCNGRLVVRKCVLLAGLLLACGGLSVAQPPNVSNNITWYTSGNTTWPVWGQINKLEARAKVVSTPNVWYPTGVQTNLWQGGGKSGVPSKSVAAGYNSAAFSWDCTITPLAANQYYCEMTATWAKVGDSQTTTSLTTTPGSSGTVR
jgi:hypothetical protein